MLRVLGVIRLNVGDVPYRVVLKVLDSGKFPVIRRVLAQRVATRLAGLARLGSAVAFARVKLGDSDRIKIEGVGAGPAEPQNGLIAA